MVGSAGGNGQKVEGGGQAVGRAVPPHNTSLVEQAQLSFSELRKIQERKEKVCVCVFVCVCVCVYVVSLSVCVNVCTSI